MNKIVTIITLSACYAVSVFAAPGDRKPKTDCVFPDSAFIDNGGRIVDITRPPYNAVGNGINDDTAAFIKAYDFVMNHVAPIGKKFIPSDPGGAESSFTIYVPNGEYLISDTIIYSGLLRYEDKKKTFTTEEQQPRFTAECVAKLRIIGQNREKTIIRLKDKSPGFGLDAEKPVISLGKGLYNNNVGYNTLRNLTINTGKGNPGAVGINWAGANNSGARNLTIRSADGQGKIGFRILINATMGYCKDITIEGFDYGIRLIPGHMVNMNFEFLTLKNQNTAGIRLDEATGGFRNVLTINSVPAIVLVKSPAHCVIDQCVFNRGASDETAIRIIDGQAFIRSVKTKGYETAIRYGNQCIKGNVDEFVTNEILTFDKKTPKKSIHLDAPAPPDVPWENDLSKWVSPNDFQPNAGSGDDDTEAIRKALNSGKPVIYFPKAEYRITDGPLPIPPSVKHITFMYSRIHGSDWGFTIDQPSDEPILLEDYNSKGGVKLLVHAANRTVVYSHIGTASNAYKCDYRGAVLFAENVNGLGKKRRNLRGASMWCRFINTEYKRDSNFVVDDAVMWVFGYKVESHQPNFEVRKNGVLELLGGTANMQAGTPKKAVIVNFGGEITATFAENGKCGRNSKRFEKAVEDIRNDQTKTVQTPDLPRREGRGKHFTLPLYNSWSEDTLSEKLKKRGILRN